MFFVLCFVVLYVFSCLFVYLFCFLLFFVLCVCVCDTPVGCVFCVLCCGVVYLYQLQGAAVLVRLGGYDEFG